MGYSKGKDGEFYPDEYAPLVLEIFEMAADGYTPSQITNYLNSENIRTHNGCCFNRKSVTRMLRNPAYKGDFIAQQFFVNEDRKLVKNTGEKPMYYIKDNHEGIVDRETWEAAQLEMTRREGYRQRYGITSIGRTNGDQLHSKIFCGKCGGKFLRRYWKGNTSIFWKCENADKKKGKKCDAEIVREKEVLEGIVKGWNELIRREDSSHRWQEMATQGDALERYRGRLFLAMSAEGKLEKEIPEMTRCFLEEIVIEKDNMLIRFLDGSEVRVESGAPQACIC